MDKQDQILKDAFLRLPKVLQNAIINADVQANLRKLAKVHKLHLDKWTILENEIMMALLGITDVNDLPYAISEQVGIPLEQALQITNSVAEIIFDPIQNELKNSVGESRNILEQVDESEQMQTNQDPSNTKEKRPIDISKFIPAPIDPAVYKPKTPKKYADNNDPYHEPIE